MLRSRWKSEGWESACGSDPPLCLFPFKLYWQHVDNLDAVHRPFCTFGLELFFLVWLAQFVLIKISMLQHRVIISTAVCFQVCGITEGNAASCFNMTFPVKCGWTCLTYTVLWSPPSPTHLGQTIVCVKMDDFLQWRSQTLLRVSRWDMEQIKLID